MNSTSLLAEISIGNALIALVVLFVLIGVAAPKKGEEESAFFGFCLLLFICTLLFTVVYFPYKWIFKRDRTTVVEKTAPPKTSPTDGNVPDNTPAVSEPKRNPPATKSVVIGEGGLPIGKPERQPPPPDPKPVVDVGRQEMEMVKTAKARVDVPMRELTAETIGTYVMGADRLVAAAGRCTTQDAKGLALLIAADTYFRAASWLHNFYDDRSTFVVNGERLFGNSYAKRVVWQLSTECEAVCSIAKQVLDPSDAYAKGTDITRDGVLLIKQDLRNTRMRLVGEESLRLMDAGSSKRVYNLYNNE